MPTKPHVGIYIYMPFALTMRQMSGRGLSSELLKQAAGNWLKPATGSCDEFMVIL